jgi:hypothetical protein
VIVRILTEGQYRVPDEKIDELNALDNELVGICQAGDEARFHELYDKLLEHVRQEGEPLGDDELMGSEIILPPPDITLEEAAAEFTGDGLIPG